MARFSLIGGVVLTALTVVVQGSAFADSPDSTGRPNFSGAWQSANDRRFDPVPGSATSPVEDDPAHPRRSRGRGANGQDVGPTPSVGNYHNPNLTEWAAGVVKKAGEDALAGYTSPTAESTCIPAGVPMILNFFEPVYFVQTPREVTILYQRGPNVRHVFMNQPHSPHPKPSWYGESIGHYDGDVLVVDTIGLNDKNVLDVYHTPHSEALHVVERYQIAGDGKTMKIEITIEDPKSFKQPFEMTTKYNHLSQPALEESICAENNTDLFTGKLFPIPVAATPDF